MVLGEDEMGRQGVIGGPERVGLVFLVDEDVCSFTALQRDAAQALLTKPGDGAGENEERKKEDRV